MMVHSFRAARRIKEAKGTLDIVSYLHRHQEACITELVKNIDVSQKTVYRAIDILLTLDLITEEKRTTFPMKRIFTLTSKGHLLAEAPLYKSNRILSTFRYSTLRKHAREDAKVKRRRKSSRRTR